MLVPIVRLALNALPDGLAYHATRTLASRTHAPAISSVERRALELGMPIRLDSGAAAWTWGDGPLVVLVHGWNGRAAQMAPLAVSVAHAGFRSVAIEITGHGDVSGRRTDWSCFLRDIPAAVRSLGTSVFAFVAHSAGALTLMAARHQGRVAAERYVLICAPTHPFPAVDVIRRRLAPRAPVIERYRGHVAGQFGVSWESLHAGEVFRGSGKETLLCYDEADRFVPHSEGDRVAALSPGVRLHKSRGRGHAGVLSAPDVLQEIVCFLCASRRAVGDASCQHMQPARSDRREESS